jgi:peptidoglycan/xylan/chitin deacetylase (PgdA/CDA1 family)
MLSYRNAVGALVAALALTGLLCGTQGLAWGWLGLPLAAYGGLIAYGSSRISSSFFIDTICAGTGGQPHIALTFDDGPLPGTPQILDILRRHQVPATFFCIGRHAAARPGLLRQMDQEGHVVGNHSFSHHPLLDLFSTARLRAELRDTDQAIAAAIGKRPRLFRPPYGVTTPNLARAIRRAGHRCIGWSVRSLDTVIKSEPRLLDNMVGALQPGAVFLFHDSSATTAAILDEFIAQAQGRGFTIVPLPQLLDVLPYE